MDGTIKTLSQDEANRYTRRNILRSERMYGHGFQSPGQLPLMKTFTERLAMRHGMNILDVGSGLGGAAFYFADHFGAKVTGLDVAPPMIEISAERAAAKTSADVRFQLGDIRTAALPAAGFDLVWSRDCILYIPEKDQVWTAVHRALAPGGQMFITDFCRRPDAISPLFADYLAQCHYHLQDVDTYAGAMAAAGLEVTVREDMTPLFIELMEREQSDLRRRRDEFLRDYDESDYDYLITRWDSKLRFCKEGDFRWGLFMARRRD
jgi:phosphoethanolamine N-methyltransferase